MEPAHAILTSSAVYLIIVIFIKARIVVPGRANLGRFVVEAGRRRSEWGRNNHTPFVPLSCITRAGMYYKQRGCNACVAKSSAGKEIYPFQQKKFHCH